MGNHAGPPAGCGLLLILGPQQWDVEDKRTVTAVCVLQSCYLSVLSMRNPQLNIACVYVEYACMCLSLKSDSWISQWWRRFARSENIEFNLWLWRQEKLLITFPKLNMAKERQEASPKERIQTWILTMVRFGLLVVSYTAVISINGVWHLIGFCEVDWLLWK